MKISMSSDNDVTAKRVELLAQTVSLNKYKLYRYESEGKSKGGIMEKTTNENG